MHATIVKVEPHPTYGSLLVVHLAWRHEADDEAPFLYDTVVPEGRDPDAIEHALMARAAEHEERLTRQVSLPADIEAMVGRSLDVGGGANREVTATGRSRSWEHPGES